MGEAVMGRLRPGGQAVVVTRTPLGGVRMNGSAPLLNTRGRGRISQALASLRVFGIRRRLGAGGDLSKYYPGRL